VKTMAEVLRAHWSASTHTEREPFVDKCDGCGAVIMTWGEGGDMPALLVAHQADALTAAGFGPVKAAAGTAWDEGFKQGGPMHDVNYDDPGAHRRNPYKA
jgi:hypothetical protein